MNERSYLTELTNDTKKALNVHELDGSVLVQLAPGQSFEVKSRSAFTAYARWSSCRWTADGKVHLIARTDFQEPERGRWVLRCLNQDGAPTEFRQIGEERVALPTGIPVLIACPILDPLVRFKELTIIRKRIQVKADEPGYCAHRWVVRDEKVPRADSELKALAKIIDDLGKK
jgi:hypothetical protein